MERRVVMLTALLIAFMALVVAASFSGQATGETLQGGANFSLCQTSFFRNVLGKQARGVGTRVLDLDTLLNLIHVHFAKDALEGEKKGQYKLVLPAEACALVSSGEGLIEGRNPEDFHARLHRGEWGAYLKREFALPVTSVTAIVYSLEACKNDPDFAEEEIAEMERLECTHSLVIFLATSQDEFGTAPMTPTTFVRNLAGANEREMSMTGDAVRTEAKQINDHWLKWAVVSD
jgi:hypothetical protein